MYVHYVLKIDHDSVVETFVNELSKRFHMIANRR